MNPIKITIYGHPVGDRKHMRIVKNGSRYHRLVPSKAYKEYERAAKFFIDCLAPRIQTPVCVKVNYYTDTNEKQDLVDLLSGTCRVLKFYNIIDDSHSDIVVSHDGSRIHYDLENPRAEIEIIPIKEVV